MATYESFNLIVARVLFQVVKVMAAKESTELLKEKHVQYIKGLNTKENELEYWLTEHLRLNGVYWGLTATCLLGQPQALDRDEMIKYVLSCRTNEGGFSAHNGHDTHLIYTLSAIQILAMQDALSSIDPEAVIKYVSSLQNRETGAFAGDTIYAEYDTRFIYCAFQTLILLNALDRVDVPLAVKYIHSCRNFDGGFGLAPHAESHAGQVWTCLGALAIAGQLHIPENEAWIETCGWWLCERQLPIGGMNGRPEKLEDVCYSWWVLSSLKMIRKTHWIDCDALITFILSAQDPDNGGIADRPGDVVDVFHTLFGIAGLSLMGYKGLESVNEVYCLPLETTKRLGL